MESVYDSAGGGAGAPLGAYGSSGGRRDLSIFLKRPQVIVRLIGFVFSIVVFGCIQSQGDDKGQCAYGENGACGYGTFVGLTAFLITFVFLVLDWMFDYISNVMRRKYIVIADIMTASIWSFLYFVCFCYLTDSWKRHYKADFWGRSGVEAAIAFSFFNIGIFIALTVLAVMRYRSGISEDLSTRSDFGYSSDQFTDSRGGQ